VCFSSPRALSQNHVTASLMASGNPAGVPPPFPSSLNYDATSHFGAAGACATGDYNNPRRSPIILRFAMYDLREMLNISMTATESEDPPSLRATARQVRLRSELRRGQALRGWRIDDGGWQMQKEQNVEHPGPELTGKMPVPLQGRSARRSNAPRSATCSGARGSS
jgi:hypothetical protein